MAAISYQIGVSQPLENVTSGTAVPTSGNGFIELRFDQTVTAITDAAAPGGTRAVKKGEVFTAVKVLLEQLIRDTNVAD